MSENEKDAAKHENHTQRAKAYTAATTALRKAHSEEFRALLHAEYESRGIPVKHRLTAEERAARDAMKVAEKAAKAAEKRQAKIDALKAEIESLEA
jgi:hypothetical protein